MVVKQSNYRQGDPSAAQRAFGHHAEGDGLSQGKSRLLDASVTLCYKPLQNRKDPNDAVW
jgi:hypothetical protein